MCNKQICSADRERQTYAKRKRERRRRRRARHVLGTFINHCRLQAIVSSLLAKVEQIINLKLAANVAAAAEAEIEIL